MKEEFLYYVWKYYLYNRNSLKTTDFQSIEIIKCGLQNKSSGPDFFEAHIRIENILWVGYVEIHVKSSDWNLHKHQYDKAYNNVILHVVFDNDIEIRNEKGETIPTIVLKDRIKPEIWKNYQIFTLSTFKFIPCENSLINFKDDFVKSHFKTRLLIERFENKTLILKERLEYMQNDWEAVLFLSLARYFGTKVNGDAMAIFAQSFDFKILKKCRHKKIDLEALFFGQAGFLEESREDEYFNRLKKVYGFLKVKYKLQPCEVSMFKFFGVRPPNYPTIRLAQLADLYFEYQNLFSLFIKLDEMNMAYSLFDIELNPYWNEYYHFGKKSKRVTKKTFSITLIDLLMINTILPIQFCYNKQQGKDVMNRVEKLLFQMKSEKNTIIKKFETLNMKADSAWDSQALIQLKTKYCNRKKCLNCEIGNRLLRNEN